MEQEVNKENVDDETDVTVDTADKADKNVVDIQSQISKAVQSRLAREKANQKQMQEVWEEERKLLQEENDFLKKQFQAKIDEQLADLPASFRSLVSKLPIKEQIEWLEEQKKENEAKPKPQAIPNFDKKNKEGKGEVQHMPLDRIV